WQFAMDRSFFPPPPLSRSTTFLFYRLPQRESSAIYWTDSEEGAVSDEVAEPRHRGDVTELLLAWSDGKDSALDQLIPLMYPELRRLAHRCVRGERERHTLNTSALINEAYLRLVDSTRVKWRDRAHLLAVSARLMRRILVDSARAQQAKKR